MAVTELQKEIAREAGRKGAKLSDGLRAGILVELDTEERQQAMLDWMKKQKTLTYGAVQDKLNELGKHSKMYREMGLLK